MSSSIWYLYEFVRKKWFKKFTNAKSEKESYIEPERFRKIPVTVDFPEKCISCSACAESCPSDAILMKHNEEYNRIMPDF
jgi:energy-converting hydrogenase A subunit P